MLILLLQDAGYTVVDKTGIGGTKALRAAMETHQIDVYAEYSSQALSVYYDLPVNAIPTEPDKVWALAKTLDERRDIFWLDHSQFNDAYSFMVRDDLWAKGIKTMQDLAQYMNKNNAPLSICMENDFFSRQYDGFPAVQRVYDFRSRLIKCCSMDLDAVYTGLRAKTCDVGEGYRTKGKTARPGVSTT